MLCLQPIRNEHMTFVDLDAVVTRSTCYSRSVFEEGFLVWSSLIIRVWLKQHGSCPLIVLIEVREKF